MKNYSIKISAILLISALSACNMMNISFNGDGQVNQGAKNSIDILSPADGAQAYIGEIVDIQSKAECIDDVSAIQLFVNGEIYYESGLGMNTSGIKIIQPWTPKAPGEYLISTMCICSNGSSVNSNTIRIIVEELEQEESPTLDQEKPIESEPEECPQPMVISTGYPFCRSGPGTGYNEITNLEPGQSFPITAISGSGSWWQIAYNASGGTCWVWADLIETCGNIEDIPVNYTPEKEKIEESTEQKETEEEAPPVYTACHDYPDLSSCNTDPMGFGGCSWNTGLNQCEP